MYETVKELHIEIEQRIQQITSNRHRSIPPQFIDMMLNRCAIKYIQSKSNRKTNYKGEGFEDSKKRVDDIQSLKKETIWLKTKVDKSDEGYSNRAFVILPGDYLKLVSSTSRYTYGKPQLVDDLHKVYEGDDIKNLYYNILDLSKINITDENYTGKIIISDNEIDISDILRLYDSDSEHVDLFEIAGLICDRLRENCSNSINIYWENLMDRYYKNCIIITSDSNINITFTVGASNVEVDTYNVTYNEFVNVGNRYSENDLVSTENIRAILNNYYSNKNRHLNPISELIDDRLFVYYGDDYCIDAIKISYIKKPRLFNIDINQMSDMNITPEFIDSVVSDILLILKDDSFNVVKQQSNLE